LEMIKDSLVQFWFGVEFQIIFIRFFSID